VFFIFILYVSVITFQDKVLGFSSTVSFLLGKLI